MTKWSAVVRQYPHFDPVISQSLAEKVASDPQAVSAHKFYPFLKYDDGWTKIAHKGERGRRKSRPIRFAARLDSVIYSYYRSLLAAPYEAKLEEAGLTEAVLAYRRLKTADGKGKCNIDFARDTFERISSYEECVVIALDVSEFFESLEHQRLKLLWADLLGTNTLPEDHFQVFKAMTTYAFVDVRGAYERLGYFGEKRMPDGSMRPGYLVAKKDVPKQLCDGRTFRAKIAGGDGSPSLIVRNRSSKGIPQGAPLSDLLANLYMLQFDKEIHSYVRGLGGTYMRYSDDILIVAPVSIDEGIQLEKTVRETVSLVAPGLVIKEEKSSLHHVFGKPWDQTVVAVLPKHEPNRSLEYLGFRFDGRRVFIRDRTMSGLYRKVAKTCRAVANSYAKRYSGKKADEILDLADLEHVVQSFGPVREFETKAADYREWTFATYVKRATRIMGAVGAPIERQTRNLRKVIRRRLRTYLVEIVGE